MMTNLLWDGSPLKKCERIKVIEHKGQIFWQLRWNHFTFVAIPVPIKNLLPIFLDECKPIFGLKKWGTHWIFWMKKKYMLLKVEETKNEAKNGKTYQSVKKWVHINNSKNNIYEEDMEKKLQFQKIIVFHYLFRLPHPQVEEMYVRNGTLIWFHHFRFTQIKEERYFSIQCHETWFPHKPLRRLMGEKPQKEEENSTINKVKQCQNLRKTPTKTLKHMLHIQEEREELIQIDSAVREVKFVKKRVYGTYKVPKTVEKCVNQGIFDRCMHRCRKKSE